MKYKSSAALRRKNRIRRLRLAAVCVLLVGAVAALCFGIVGAKNLLGMISFGHAQEESPAAERKTAHVQRHRLDRDAIPAVNFYAVSYSATFDDLNDIQLEAAMKNGIKDLEHMGNPADSPEMVGISTNDLYVVDSMTHSVPYLVPEAALMLHYIGLRFQEVLDEMAVDEHGYRPIVTSAFRSKENVENLRRRNRNASENSCHCFGTTIDITYIRFMRDDGEVVNEEWLMRALSTALYELHYEGVCYVKYEYRQACYHITVRTTDYSGPESSHLCSYREDYMDKHVAKPKRRLNLFAGKAQAKQPAEVSEYVAY